MITAKVDQQALSRSLKRAAKAFGETGAQAVTRWGVQAARELARQTQAWGVGSKPKAKQDQAIVTDAFNVLIPKAELPRVSRKALRSASEVEQWIESNRRGKRARTIALPDSEKKLCTWDDFWRAVGERKRKAGIAKGGWIGAGLEIAARGAKSKYGQSITIGKNLIPYASAHVDYGNAKPPRFGWKNVAELLNRARHTSNKSVLSDSAANRAVKMALKNTLKWYEKATAAELKKK